MTVLAPQPIETSTQSPLGAAVPVSRHPLAMSPLNRRRWQNFKANRRGYWSLWIFLDAVRDLAVRGADRQRPPLHAQV